MILADFSKFRLALANFDMFRLILAGIRAELAQIEKKKRVNRHVTASDAGVAPILPLWCIIDFYVLLYVSPITTCNVFV